MNVVPMKEEHLEQVAAIEEACFSLPWSLEAFREELSQENAVYLAALWEDRVIGYGGMRHAAGEFYVDNIAVSPLFRRRGAGEAVLTELIARAAGLGGEFISLEVRPSNEPAIRLYEKLGFLRVGRRKDFYERPREDGLIYTRAFCEKDREHKGEGELC